MRFLRGIINRFDQKGGQEAEKVKRKNSWGLLPDFRDAYDNKIAQPIMQYVPGVRNKVPVLQLPDIPSLAAACAESEKTIYCRYNVFLIIAKLDISSGKPHGYRENPEDFGISGSLNVVSIRGTDPAKITDRLAMLREEIEQQRGNKEWKIKITGLEDHISPEEQ